MKLALALIAASAYAVKVEDLMDELENATSVTLYDDMTWTAEFGDSWDCDNEWIWEECSWMYYRSPCEGEGDTDCGWVYWDDWSFSEFWVDCDEFNSWDSCNGNWDDWEDDTYQWCDNEWIWEDCSQMEYRNTCDFEDWGSDCGWVYWDDWSWTEFFVTCDDFSTWESCNGGWTEPETAQWCDNEWIWEDCSQMEYRNTCDFEDWGSDCGWVYWDDWNWMEFFVTCDEFSTWESCNGGWTYEDPVWDACNHDESMNALGSNQC